MGASVARSCKMLRWVMKLYISHLCRFYLVLYLCFALGILLETFLLVTHDMNSW